MLLSPAQLATLFGIIYSPFLVVLVVNVLGWLNDKRRDWVDARAEARERAAARNTARATESVHVTMASAAAEA